MRKKAGPSTVPASIRQGSRPARITGSARYWAVILTRSSSIGPHASVRSFPRPTIFFHSLASLRSRLPPRLHLWVVAWFRSLASHRFPGTPIRLEAPSPSSSSHIFREAHNSCWPCGWCDICFVRRGCSME